ncbi:MAG: hypothetical protein ACTJH0_10200 [Psychrobacter sp.]
MGAKKILSYSRFILGAFLAVYLLLVWMYFKDNARQLTSSGLLLWFVAIPILLFGTIMALLWWQKKLDKQESQASDTLDETSNKKESAKLPDTYQLFVFSRICLPEGDSWSDVINNDQDLTLLSDELTDFDGLPVLVKPITRLADATSLPYRYISDEPSDDITLRLCSLIHEQLTLSEELWSTLAEHLDQYQQDNTQPNSAINVHPEWQQHYLVGSEEKHKEDTITATSVAHLSTLPIYLCLPIGADSAPLIAIVKEHLATYGIPETLLSFTLIETNNDDAKDLENKGESDPASFINEHLTSLSLSAMPEMRLLIIADTQLSDEWLDQHLYPHQTQTTNIIPTEAGALLVFFNKAAQDLLDIETNTSVLLTEVHTPDAKHHDSHTTERMNNRRGYLNHLTTIKNLLIDNELSLVPTNTASPKTLNKPTTKPDDTETKTNVAPLDTSITAISDINPSTQPYDMSVYMSFVEAFITKGALVNEYHLGHYMPLNNWLKPFISLSLFVNLAEKDQQESDSVFLITQHKHCSMLWLADDFQKSEP